MPANHREMVPRRTEPISRHGVCTRRATVSAYPQHVSIAATRAETIDIPLAKARGAEDAAIGQLAALMIDVAAQFDPQRPRPQPDMVAECNAVIEGCLEVHRPSDREASLVAAKDELRRLAKLLTIVDIADVAMVLRQIRRVLGRFDALAAG
jgi:hypothetical protein